MSTDAYLLTRFGAGQEEAFETLFARHYRTVYGILHRLVGDDAEDLAQEVFLRLYHYPPALAGGSDKEGLRAWLYRVALRLGYNTLRSRRRWNEHRDALGRDGAIGSWQTAEPDPEAYAERMDECARVRQSLARLGQKEASVLVLRYSDLSYREIADVLGVAPSSVGTLLARAERAFERAYTSVSGVEGKDVREG